MAAYYYGIELYEASAPTHDDKTGDGREVQIKITQQDRVVINEEPDYLIVLYLNRSTGEIYNGTGAMPWETAYIYEKHNTRYMMVSKLIEMDRNVNASDRIPMIHQIDKYVKPAKPSVAKASITAGDTSTKVDRKAGKTLDDGCVQSYYRTEPY